MCPAPVVISTIHSVAETRARLSGYRGTRPDLPGSPTHWRSDGVRVEAAAERHLAARAVSAARLRVIPNGVDTGRFRPDAGRRERTRR